MKKCSNYFRLLILSFFILVGIIPKLQAQTTLWHIVDNNGSNPAIEINQALTTYKHVALLPNKVYELTGNDRIVIGENIPNGSGLPNPVGQTLYVPASTTILFDRINGGGSFAAIEMQTRGALIGDGKIKLNDNTWQWNNNGKAAISITGNNIKIDFGIIENFEYGITMGGPFGIQGCNIRIRTQENCLRGVVITPNNGGFVNNNYIHLDDMVSESTRVNSQSTAWSESCGIYMEGGNCNTFSGHVEGTKIGVNLVGKYNRIEGLRLENCTTRIRIEGDYNTTRNNYLFGTFGEIDGIDVPYAGQMPTVNNTGQELSQVLSIYGWADWTLARNMLARDFYNYSDERIKNNIEDVTGALNKILALKGKIYNYKTTKKKSNIKETKSYGFIAQELKEVLPELVIRNPSDSLYAINYDGVIPILVEAMKEQQLNIEKKESDIEDLKKMNADLITILKEKGILNNTKDLISNDKPILYQNNPNPFVAETKIDYYLPGNAKEPFLIITDLNGKMIKKIDIIATGNNSIVIKGGELNPGMYIYSMFSDNKMIGTKRMVLTDK